MTMKDTPRAMQPQIGLFGRRNAGKSSLLNFILGGDLALVSPVPGTTADPLEKSIELPKLGPVTLIDTPGLDDSGELGGLRAQKGLSRLASVHLALLVTDGTWGEPEQAALAELQGRDIPCLIVLSKADLGLDAPPVGDLPLVSVSAKLGQGMADLLAAIGAALPDQALAPAPLLRDLIKPVGLCLLVTPIDSGAPKGRLIAPQVQALRDCLDGHLISLVVQPEELAKALAALVSPPDLVVCDSQAVARCAELVPSEVPLTTFSILMARLKGDLPPFCAGAAAIDKLEDGDLVYVCEVCAHHALADDIGRVKIPALLRKYTGKNLEIRFASGRDYPADLAKAKLAIHCGGCMIGRPLMQARQEEARRLGVPLTNYGVAISLMQGVLTRALNMFPDAFEAFQAQKKRSL